MDSSAGQESDSQSGGATVPSKRRRTAPLLTDCCRTCRLRKVKCSGNPGNGPCTNCERLELGCSFVPAEEPDEAAARTIPSHSHTEAGTLRKRAQRACSQCHSHKTKCSGDLPRCKRCEAAGLACEYTPAKRRFTNVKFQNAGDQAESPSSESVSPLKSPSTGKTLASRAVNMPDVAALIAEGANLTAEDMLIRRDVLLQHFDAYMDHLYWIPSQGFLHPDNTYREIQEGTLDSVIAAAMCAISSCFVDPGEAGREFAARCSQIVDMHLYQNIYKFSEDLLVVFALSITSQLLRGEFAKVWQAFGVASRLMLGLRVNWDVPSGHKSFIHQETIRRTVWQYFHVDRMLAGGYDEYISCRAEIMKIPLPCAEVNFIENRPVAAEKLDDKPASKPNTVNMHAYQLRLMDIRHRIQVFVKRLSNVPQQPVDASKLMGEINALQNELTRFHMCLPSELLLTDQSVAKFMRRPERVGFVWLHAHLHVSHIDLYRFTLPRQRDKASADVLRRLPRDFLAKAQKQAVTHAMAMARFYDAIQIELDKLPKTNRMVLAGDYSAFQMSTHCVRVLLLAMQFGLYKDLTDVPTSALWQKIKPDEAYLRYLIDAVQRVNEPWCVMMDVARQAYEHNAAMVEEFNKTRKVADQRAAESMFTSKSDGPSSRLPGPDAILESIANGKLDDSPGRFSSSSPPDATRWGNSDPSPGQASQAASDDSETGSHAPGIPMILAQARGQTAIAPAPTALTYDSDNALLPMSELDAVLPEVGPAPSPRSDARVHHLLSGPGGSGDFIFQQPMSQPNSTYAMMAQQQGYMGMQTDEDGYRRNNALDFSHPYS